MVPKKASRPGVDNDDDVVCREDEFGFVPVDVRNKLDQQHLAAGTGVSDLRRKADRKAGGKEGKDNYGR